jgi:hypothetical protein
MSAVATESVGAVFTADEVEELAFERLALMMEYLDVEELHERAMCRFCVEHPGVGMSGVNGETADPVEALERMCGTH